MAGEDLQGWLASADAAERRGDGAALVDALERAAALAPGEPKLWKRLARSYQDVGRYQETLAALVRAAELYTRAGAGIQAIAVCNWILDVDPMHTATLDRLAALRDGVGPAAARPARARPAARPAARGAAPIEELLLVEEAADVSLDGGADEVDVTEVLELDDEVVGEDVVAPALGDEGGGKAPRAGAPPAPALERAPAVECAPAAELPCEPDPPAADPEARAAARSLVATPIFGRLGVRALRKLVAAARRVAVAEGDVVFREGDAPDALYVVVEGAVVPIAEATDASPRRRLGVIEAGGYFGEIALVTNEPRNATIEALVDTELLAIDRAVVAELLDEEPEMLAVLLRLLRERLVARLVRTSAVFAGLAAAERRALARRFRLLEVRAGATLIEQGQAASALYLVLAGALRASAREDACGEKEIATLGPGAPCGEMSLLRGVPASATVRAARKSWVLMLPRAEFERAAEEARGLRERLAAIADARRAEGLAAFDPEDSFDDADVVELV